MVDVPYLWWIVGVAQKVGLGPGRLQLRAADTNTRQDLLQPAYTASGRGQQARERTRGRRGGHVGGEKDV